MKTLHNQLLRLLLLLTLIGNALPIVAQEQDMKEVEEAFYTVSGSVRDKETRRKLEYVNISIPGTNIGTITNEDGEFSIKVKKSLHARQLEVSHIGYLNGVILLEDKDMEKQMVWLEPNMSSIEEIIIRADDPKLIVQAAIDRIGDNYSPTGNLLTGFYRETIQKGRRYINIAEAIVEVHKKPYTELDVYRDRVQIYKGRKLLSQRVKDTLAVKLQGGPNLSVYMDVVKNPNVLFDPEIMECYGFRLEVSVMLDERPHYVVSFYPRVILPIALYYGTFYIDKENLTFSRIEFNLSMDDQNKATAAILRKKPYGLRFKPEEVSFLVSYKEREGISYLSYVRNEVKFKCDWKRKLFSTNYTIVSEMVVTDGKVQEELIPYKASFKDFQSLSDKVSDFADDSFWGAYNIIEPTESLENAVHKLKKQHRD